MCNQSGVFLLEAPKPANVRKPAPKQTLTQYMAKKKLLKSKRVHLDLPSEIRGLEKDLKALAVKFKKRGSYTCKQASGYYSYLLTIARRIV